MSKRTDDIPEWIEPNLFENVLREAVGDFSKITKFEAFNALPPGENYATVMIKIAAEVLLKNGVTHSESFMLKVAHNSELYQKEMKKWNMFTTEAGMYTEIVPDFEEIYANVGLKVKFGANCFKLPIQKEYILLENLSEIGFRNAPRQDCLDMEHCKAVLKKLAQWHAASAVRFENKGPYEYTYTKGIFIDNGTNILQTMMNSSLKHLLNSARKLPNNKEYLSELEDLKDKVMDLFCKPGSLDENEFNVLNHGDCWCNNIMFQYDKAGNLQETYFVDLQIPNYGSPARDLLYFIFSSAQLEIKVNKYDYMIKYYYDNLIENLKLLKYGKPLPKLKELHMSLIKHSYWGFFAALVTMAAVLCDTTEEASADNLIGDCQEADKFKAVMYSNDRFVKHLEVVLPWLCYRGAFEQSV